MSDLARLHRDFRSKAMNDIFIEALALNHPDYMLKHEHRQIAVAAAWFILWLSYESVVDGKISSMLTDDV